METQLEQLVSLLLAKETQIKELTDYIVQLQQKLEATQSAYAKLYKIHYLSKKKKIQMIRRRIGFKK